ncbi:T9SS type A sorting domain-containing protein, partial [bacterium]|nr:T9SS type A sorting domain-containing protein [bacterium]
ENGDTVEIEIDKEIYYEYVVQPKLSDEIPIYINPETGTPANPPTGVFWRSWFWTHADSGYAYYNEQWSDCEFLWDRTGNTADAIDVVNSWVGSVMNWGAGSERPIQPVRIYALHCGNCGEYQDIRAAAGRIALIPTACTSNICEDHVWNEFWEREWIHWDGGDVNNPLLYENGWGKVLSAVFNWRGDGYVWTVTERYSADVCTLNVMVLDSASKPADGYRIKVYSDFIYGGTYYTTWGVTDADGQVSFVLGDSKNYYLRLEGPLGNFPVSSTATVNVIQNSQPGQAYFYEYAFSASSPNLNIAEQQSYPNPLDDYRLEITYDLQFESIYGNFFTYQSTVPVEFTERRAEGTVDFFMLNAENFAAYDTTDTAEGFEIAWNSPSGIADFVLPTEDTWYGVLSNREVSVVNPCMFVNVNVYRNAVPVVDLPIADLPLEFRLGTPYPNPFNSETTISFALPHDDFVNLQLFDISGRLVSQLASSRFIAGEHQLSWNSASTDASGIYLLKMNAGKKQFSQKLVLLK